MRYRGINVIGELFIRVEEHQDKFNEKKSKSN